MARTASGTVTAAPGRGPAGAAVLAATLGAALGLLSLPLAAAAQDTEAGRVVYDRWCAECHGAEGAGDGPAADHMLPRPRDFTAARYQIRTTGSGELPTTEDILAVVRDGMPGTAMPGWPNLTEDQQRDVAAYLKTFSRFFEDADPEPLEFSADPGGGESAVEAGREVYVQLECVDCHGQEGRGDGPSAPTLEDWRELPIRAADLTEAWNFNGGSTVEAIHHRILTGLDGTPMPAAIDAVRSEVVSEEQVWQLAHYVASLGPRQRPPVREVVRVSRRDGGLPSAPGDSVWAEAESYWFPLVGQVVETPRQFAPTVDGVWVQGFHDGEELVLRLTWHDPSESPAPRWDEWQARMADALFADGAEIPTEPLPDAFAVQFPPQVPTEGTRPYFLMGDAQDPVILWRWDSRDGVSRARARGLGGPEPLDAAGLRGEASWEAGRWRLVLRRPLDGGESGPSFPEGTAAPLAFFAWDGSSGEEGLRGSVSSWYYVTLEEPRSRIVFVAPLVAVLVTGGLGLFAVRRARA